MTSRLENQRTSSAKLSLPGASGVPQVLPDMVTMPFEAGQVIHGKYELLRLIGTGGVGFVVAARHIGFDDVVALKFLRPEYATNVEAVSRFTIEARASFKLRSEHVARVLDVDMFEQIPFIAMELLEGFDLRTMLDRRRVLDVAPAIDCILQACDALAAAHAIGVIHRDIKPENLFLVGAGDELDQVKVLDFGISKVALISNGRQTHQALTRIAVGTPPYMSPEQVRASSNLDARSDLWSLGCVLYEMLTGTAPFDRISLMQSCAAVLEEEPVSPRDLNPQLPAELSDTIMRCLRKDPASRFNDVAELAEALTPFGSGKFATYASRCRAFLLGEGPGRRSTPSALMPVSPRITGSVPSSSSVSGVHTAQTRRSIAVRLESSVPVVRQPSLGASAAPLRAHPTNLSTRNRAPTHAPAQPPVTLVPDPALPDRFDGELPDEVIPKSRSTQWLMWSGLAVTLGLLASYLISRESGAHLATLMPTVRPAQAAAPAENAEADRADPTTIPVVLPSAEPGANEAPAAPATDATATLEEVAAAPNAPAKVQGAGTPATSPRSRPKAHTSSTSSGKPTTSYRVSDEPDVGF